MQCFRSAQRITTQTSRNASLQEDYRGFISPDHAQFDENKSKSTHYLKSQIVFRFEIPLNLIPTHTNPLCTCAYIIIYIYTYIYILYTRINGTPLAKDIPAIFIVHSGYCMYIVIMTVHFFGTNHTFKIIKSAFFWKLAMLAG